ncbi:hypothetical protein XFF6990_390141 [Xanthomonas citri pv. fuscans]|nr:hypothetical protein XFF6990_390141 [Xanthomonas citri pv. fuscans]
MECHIQRGAWPCGTPTCGTHALAEGRRLDRLILFADSAAPKARRASRSGCDLARSGDSAFTFAIHVAAREVCHAAVTIRP